ncbi:hypothetical protein GTW66_06615 [Streptomyces sp. SID5473]|uniref:hypothetical protein n=1 Tax=Streptomyces sp. SID5473 TaxID=2690299 RepID=UPI00131E4137|nr:hypothetical protein [Streptomyces sp. SID5473]MYS63783.1 hypothetical protein [Streptomyces sp. SID5473]
MHGIRNSRPGLRYRNRTDLRFTGLLADGAGAAVARYGSPAGPVDGARLAS